MTSARWCLAGLIVVWLFAIWDHIRGNPTAINAVIALPLGFPTLFVMSFPCPCHNDRRDKK